VTGVQTCALPIFTHGTTGATEVPKLSTDILTLVVQC
jgi:hypothetical protein